MKRRTITSKKIDYYQSSIGMPYAVLGKKIARIAMMKRRGAGVVNHYASMTIKKFEKIYFPVSNLRKVVRMPRHLRKALRKELEKEG